jgi:hypothetical protein
LKEIPFLQTRESFEDALERVRAYSTTLDAPNGLATWLEHKNRNPWIFLCVCTGLTWMPRIIWDNTSYTTNAAESAHALSQRYGTRLTLVAAVQQGKKIDEQSFLVHRSIRDSGVSRGYGNRSGSGRGKRNLVRREARARKRKEREEQEHEDEEEVEE